MKFHSVVLLLVGIVPGIGWAQLPQPTPVPVAPSQPAAPSQSAPPPLQLEPMAPSPTLTLVGPTAPVPAGPPAAPAAQCQFHAEYLYWWLKVPQSPPLLTTSRPEDQGILGRPSTQILAGGGGGNFENIMGVRLGVAWFCDPSLTVELGGSYLSNGGRYPTYLRQNLAVPYFDPTTQTFTSLELSNSLGATGYAAVQTYAQLWEMAAQAVLPTTLGATQPVDLLLGLRYVQLFEDLRLWTYTQNNATVLVQGHPAPLGTKYAGFDQFQTKNQFYGAQAGMRFHNRCDQWSFEGTALVAVGVNQQELEIKGQTNVNVPPSATQTGNIFSEQTNIGRYNRDVFAVIPQGQVKVGYQLFETIRLTGGCDLLYWSDVVRPGNQIQAAVNPSLIPMLNQTVQGVPLPQPTFQRSDLWLVGLSVGMELTF